MVLVDGFPGAGGGLDVLLRAVVGATRAMMISSAHGGITGTADKRECRVTAQ